LLQWLGMEISDDQFSEMIDEAFEHLPKAHRASVKNVAIVYADEPTPEQRERLKLECNQTLYGLYEGVPLAHRQGHTGYPPDKITIFKLPLLHASYSEAALRENIRHTVWHEVAHYFGLDHDQIHKLER
jgi:predicted Zn-dependent protease with MMP-like domain